MNRWNLFFSEVEITLEEFLLRAVAEGCGLQKQIDPLVVRHVHKCLEYGALLVTGSVDHKVVTLLVFLLRGFNTYELFLSRHVTGIGSTLNTWSTFSFSCFMNLD